MTNLPLLEIDLRAEYGGRPVLHRVHFTLRSGELLGLVGTSGAGKSTLVLSLLGLLPWRGGRVQGTAVLEGSDLLALNERGLRRVRGRRIALIPQSPMSALNPSLSLESHFMEAWRAHSDGSRAALDRRLHALLTEVQLPVDREFLRRRPKQISVGQAQRVLIALALLHNPALVVADEPTSALDPVTQVQVLSLLKSANRDHGVAMLYISHDLVSVIQLCDRVAVLDQGRIVEVLPVSELSMACHPVTRALIGSLPAPVDVLLRFRNSATPASIVRTEARHPFVQDRECESERAFC